MTETLCDPKRDFGKRLCVGAVVRLKSRSQLREDHLSDLNIGCLDEVVRITQISLNKDEGSPTRFGIHFEDYNGTTWGGWACHVHSIISTGYRPLTNIDNNGNLVQ